MSAIRDFLNEQDDCEYMLLEPEYYDEAIVGLTEQAIGKVAVCYERAKVIEILMRESDMDEEEAEEFFSFNIVGAYVGESSPIFLTKVEQLPLDIPL